MNTTATDHTTGESYPLVPATTITPGDHIRRWHNREGVRGPVLTVSRVIPDGPYKSVYYVGVHGSDFVSDRTMVALVN